MYANTYQPQPNTNTAFSIEPLQHQLKIMDILRFHLPEFAKEYTATPDPEFFKTEIEDYISDQIIVFLTNLKCSYMFRFQGKGPDIIVSQFGCRVKSLPLFVIEAKRLRDASKKKYVTSGIARFKTTQHGVGHNFVAMLGYVQENDFDYWYGRVNTWIGELAEQNDSIWNKSEYLKQIHKGVLGEYESTHSRRNGQEIKIYHFWINI